MEPHVREKIYELFTQIPLFKSFSAADIKEKFFKQGLAKIIEYKPAEEIIREGRYDNWVYWLIDGKIEVVKVGCRVATFERVGDMFGEMGIFEGDARSASVYACSPTACLAIDMSILDHPNLEHSISREGFCRDVAHVTRNRLASTTLRLAAAERALTSTIEKLEDVERRYRKSMQTIKKTLEKLDAKDREISGLKKKLAAARQALERTQENPEAHRDKH